MLPRRTRKVTPSTARNLPKSLVRSRVSIAESLAFSLTCSQPFHNCSDDDLADLFHKARHQHRLGRQTAVEHSGQPVLYLAEGLCQENMPTDTAEIYTGSRAKNQEYNNRHS